MRVKYRYRRGLAEYENDQVAVGRGLFLGIYWVIRHTKAKIEDTVGLD